MLRSRTFIVVATMSIVWVTVVSMLRDSVDVTQLEIELFIQSDTGYTVYDNEKGYVFVQVARGSDEYELDSMQITLDLDGNSHKARVIAPGINNTQSYLFNLDKYTDVDGEIKNVRAAIAPIFLINGKRRLGAITSEILVPKKSITQEVNDSITSGDILFYELDLEKALEDFDEDDQDEDLPPLQEKEETCPVNKQADGMGGCAGGVGGVYSVNGDVSSNTQFDFEGTAGSWNGKYVKFKNLGDCVVSESACDEISGTGGGGWNGKDYIALTTPQDGLTTNVGTTPCQPNEKFYVYNDPSCE